MAEGTTKNLRRCSFCGRSEEEITFLIPARDGKTFICNDCISVCSDFIDEQLEAMSGEGENDALSFESLPKPKDIKEMLDQHVIGQEAAKLALSVAVYNHYKRILTLDDNKKSRKRKKKAETRKFSVMRIINESAKEKITASSAALTVSR